METNANDNKHANLTDAEINRADRKKSIRGIIARNPLKFGLGVAAVGGLYTQAVKWGDSPKIRFVAIPPSPINRDQILGHENQIHCGQFMPNYSLRTIYENLTAAEEEKRNEKQREKLKAQVKRVDKAANVGFYGTLGGLAAVTLYGKHKEGEAINKIQQDDLRSQIAMLKDQARWKDL